MFVIIGFVIVIGCVLGGFAMEHGPFKVLMQYIEFIIIGGSAAGSLIVSSPLRVLKGVLGSFGTILKGDVYTKDKFLALLGSQFELFNTAARGGLMSVEPHIEKPENSDIFKRNAFLLHNHHALHFLCDSLKLLLAGGTSPFDLEAMMDADIEAHHSESGATVAMIQKVGDALPGLGIVAAVLGIVITMGKIGGPPEEIGHSVAAALVGTFLGVLLSYGVVGPLATNLELLQQAEARYYECIKAGVVAYAKGVPPVLAAEFARRVIYNAVRPSFSETEEMIRGLRKAAPAK